MQKPDQRGREPFSSKGRKPAGENGSHQTIPAKTESSVYGSPTLEEVLETANVRVAWQQVKRNRGAPEVDGMTVEEAASVLRPRWASIREKLLKGKYQPAPLRRVDIPKVGKGRRMLGIPTVLDRILQQAVAQRLTPIYEPTFSESSFGFRPGRSAHQAIQQAKEYLTKGNRWVVDLDLSKYFDRVNHDLLMGRLAKRISDRRLLRLIRAWLEAGMMSDGVVQRRQAGTPQGSPLSPLLANILLDELDKRLEAAGHKFCRYADDCNVYVRSKRAGERVMAWMCRFLEGTLKLKVNETKSAVDRPWNRKFLGFSFTRNQSPKVRVAKESWQRFESRVRRITSRRRGICKEQMVSELNRLVVGWRGYFGPAETLSAFGKRDAWIRRRLRCFVLKQWKTPKTIASELRKRGARETGCIGGSRKGWWRLSKTTQIHHALNRAFFRKLGVAELAPSRT